MEAYRFSTGFVVRWLVSMLLMRPRMLHSDAAVLLRRRRFAIRGAGYVPSYGPFIVVMNHYERAGMGVWWPAFLVSYALVQTRSDARLSWLITNRFYRFRLRGVRLPDRVVSWFLARVAARYGLILVARVQAAAMARAVALRRARRLLQAHTPPVIATTPEGERAAGTALAQPVPTSGKALAWLARDGIPIVPVGVYEEMDGTLVARFGAIFSLPWSGPRHARAMQQELADTVMTAIAGCLPVANRGPYTDHAPSSSEAAP